MYVNVYVVVNVSTGEIAHSKAYLNVRDAKLALKCHFRKRAENYAVARIGSEMAVVSTVDKDGKWTEVSA